jgi:hypothetical protein
MQELKKIETAVLLTMLEAYSSYYVRPLTECELIDCDITITQLKDEITSRKDAKVLH